MLNRNEYIFDELFKKQMLIQEINKIVYDDLRNKNDYEDTLDKVLALTMGMSIDDYNDLKKIWDKGFKEDFIKQLENYYLEKGFEVEKRISNKETGIVDSSFKNMSYVIDQALQENKLCVREGSNYFVLILPEVEPFDKKYKEIIIAKDYIKLKLPIEE